MCMCVTPSSLRWSSPDASPWGVLVPVSVRARNLPLFSIPESGATLKSRWCSSQVDYGRPVAVYADRLGPDAGRFVQPFPLFLDLEGVESPFQIALRRDAPCSVVGGPHLQPLLRFPAFARSVEVQPDLVGRGRPKRKDGTLRGVCQFQIAPVIAGISVERIGLSGRWMVFLSRHGMFFRSSEFAYRLRLPVRRRLFPRRPDARAACVWGRRM